jgi:membrane protease YdiL (CAAX protease family)
VVLGLGVFDVVRSAWIDDGVDTVVNAVLGVALLALGFGLGLDRAALGLEPRRVGRGLRYGAGAWAIVAVVLVIGALVPATRDWFRDGTADVSTLAMLGTVLVVIPLGTALLEEAAFRGLLLGLFATRTTRWRATLLSSVLFGLWHIPPTINSTDGSGVIGDTSRSDGTAVLAVVGVVAGTTLAGLVFCWLRHRARSLVAPFVAHWGVNATAFFLAWLVTRA